MKRKDSDAAAGLEAEWKIPQECFQRSEFVVYRNAQCLKNAANGILVPTRLTNSRCELQCRRRRRVQYRARDTIRIRLI